MPLLRERLWHGFLTRVKLARRRSAPSGRPEDKYDFRGSPTIRNRKPSWLLPLAEFSGFGGRNHEFLLGLERPWTNGWWQVSCAGLFRSHGRIIGETVVFCRHIGELGINFVGIGGLFFIFFILPKNIVIRSGIARFCIAIVGDSALQKAVRTVCEKVASKGGFRASKHLDTRA